MYAYIVQDAETVAALLADVLGQRRAGKIWDYSTNGIMYYTKSLLSFQASENLDFIEVYLHATVAEFLILSILFWLSPEHGNKTSR